MFFPSCLKSNSTFFVDPNPKTLNPIKKLNAIHLQEESKKDAKDVCFYQVLVFNFLFQRLEKNFLSAAVGCLTTVCFVGRQNSAMVCFCQQHSADVL